MSALIFLAIVAVAMTPDGEPDVAFAKWQTFDARQDKVEIWTRPKWVKGQEVLPDFLMKRTISYRPELRRSGETVYWASVSTCPQGRFVIEQLGKLPTPAIAMGEAAKDQAIIVRADGASYWLAVKAYYPGVPGRIELTFGVETPVAEWIDESFRSLSTCWQDRQPNDR